MNRATHNKITSFTLYSDKSRPLRTLAGIGAGILAIKNEAECLLNGLLTTERAP